MAPALIDLVEGSRQLVERSFSRLTTAPKDPSDLDALVGRRHWVRAGLSDFGTNISGGLRAVMVAVPTESRASKAPLRRNPNTNRTSGTVPVSTAVLAAIMSAILTVALCIAFYKYGFSLFRACRTRISINAPRGSNLKPTNSTKEKKISFRSSRVLTLPANPFQANPIQPRIQEGSYDNLPPIPDLSTWIRPVSYPPSLQYQVREAEAHEDDIEDDMGSLIIDIKPPLQFSISPNTTVHDIQHEVPSVKRLNSDDGIPQMKPAAMAPNTQRTADAQYAYPPSASKRKPVTNFEELAEPEDGYSSQRDDLPHRRSQRNRQSVPNLPRTRSRPRFSESSREALLTHSDDSAETGQELNVSDFQNDVPNSPRRHTSLPQNQQYQVPESMMSLDSTTSFFPPTSPSIAEQLADAKLKHDPINPLPPPYLVKVVRTFQPSLPDEMEVVFGETLTILHIFTDGWCLVQRFYSSKIRGEEDEEEMEQIGVVPVLCLAPSDDVRLLLRTGSGTMDTANQPNVVPPGSPSQEMSRVSPPDYSDSESKSETGSWPNSGSGSRWPTKFISFSPVPSLNFDVAGSEDSALTKGSPTLGKTQTHMGLTGRPAAVVRRPMAPVLSRGRGFHTLLDKTCLS